MKIGKISQKKKKKSIFGAPYLVLKKAVISEAGSQAGEDKVENQANELKLNHLNCQSQLG